MTVFESHLGEIMALLAAVTWALAVILFKKSGESVHPVGLNVFKNLLAAVLYIPTAWFLGESLLRPAPVEHYLLLLASGALGIGIADTLFFMSLNALGAGLSAIVDCLYSPFIIGLSMLWLNESLTGQQALGVVLIISAVATVTKEGNHHPRDRRRIWLGLLWGALAMATMAVGIVMVKPILKADSILWATEVRVAGGLMILALMLAFNPKRRAILSSIRSRKSWWYTLSGSFVGTYLAMFFWLGGMTLTKTSIAAALNQTSNIFIFIFAALILKEKITPIRLAAITLGVTGALLVSFG